MQAPTVQSPVQEVHCMPASQDLAHLHVAQDTLRCLSLQAKDICLIKEITWYWKDKIYMKGPVRLEITTPLQDPEDSSLPQHHFGTVICP